MEWHNLEKSLVIMKRLLIILFVLPVFAKAQLGIVSRGDTIFSFDPATNTFVQLTKLVPSQTGQAGKFLSTNGTNYQWLSGDTTYISDFSGKVRSLFTASSGLTYNNGQYYIGTGQVSNTMLANTAVALLSGTNSGDNAVNSNYASDYRAANFIAGTNYLAPNGNGSSLTGITSSQIGLGNVTNESKATMFSNPTFTGTVTLPNSTVTDAMLAGSISDGKISSASTWSAKQDALGFTPVPNTRTINGQPLSGNVTITATDVGLGNVTNESKATMFSSPTFTGAVTLPNSTVTDAMLSGSISDAKISSATTWNAKQSALVSGTNIKTINGTTLLGSGDIGVSGTSTATYVNLANNFSSSSTTESAVTGWSFAVTAGSAYRVEVIGLYQTAATTTGGELGFFLTNSGAGTIVGNAEGAIVSTAAASSLSQQISAIGAADLAGSNLITTGVTAINSPHYIKSTVVFRCTVSGTFNVGWASEVNASASQLNAGSSLIYQVLN